MKLKQYLEARKKALFPAKISFSNIKAVIQAFFRKKIAGFSLPKHIYEQIVWRRTRVMTISPECWNEGHCRICGCEILGKTMEDRGCAMNEIPVEDRDNEVCYPAMLKKDEWEAYKITNKIKLFI